MDWNKLFVIAGWLKNDEEIINNWKLGFECENVVSTNLLYYSDEY